MKTKFELMKYVNGFPRPCGDFIETLELQSKITELEEERKQWIFQWENGKSIITQLQQENERLKKENDELKRYPSRYSW